MSVMCNSCGQPVRWVKTAAKGKPMPLDPEPTLNGNVTLNDQGRAVVHGTKNPAPFGVRRYTTHWATCPRAAEHRRKK